MKYAPWFLVLLVALAGAKAWAGAVEDAREEARVRGAVERIASDLREQNAALADSLHALTVRAERADSARAVSAARARALAERWREATQTESPADTEPSTTEPSVPVAVGDSLVAACELALDDCDRALAARDSVILGERSLRFAEAERADSLEALSLALAGTDDTRPLWHYLPAPLAGCGVAALMGEPCAKGAAIGGGVNIVLFGLDDVVETLREVF